MPDSAHDQLVLAHEPEHRTGAFIQQIQIEMAFAETEHAVFEADPFTPQLFEFGSKPIGLGLGLAIGGKPVLALEPGMGEDDDGADKHDIGHRDCYLPEARSLHDPSLHDLSLADRA